MLTAVSADSFSICDCSGRVNERAADTQMLFAHHGLTLRDKKAPSVFFVKTEKYIESRFTDMLFYRSHQATSEPFQSVVNPEISKISFMNEEQTIIASNEEIQLGADQ